MEDADYNTITRPYFINSEKLREWGELKITPLHFVSQDVSSSALCSLIAEKPRIKLSFQTLIFSWTFCGANGALTQLTEIASSSPKHQTSIKVMLITQAAF